MTVEAGDILIVPRFSPNARKITVTWSQRFKTRSADYYAIIARNKNRREEEVPFFIAAEWYEDPKDANDHLGHSAENYEFKVDGKAQYGQKSDKGDLRFVVYHDEGRKIYQSRFIETTIQGQVGDFAAKVAGLLGYGSEVGRAQTLAKDFIGDFLRTF